MILLIGSYPTRDIGVYAHVELLHRDRDGYYLTMTLVEGNQPVLITSSRVRRKRIGIPAELLVIAAGIRAGSRFLRRLELMGERLGVEVLCGRQEGGNSVPPAGG